MHVFVFKSLAGPISTIVGSFNSFLQCEDSDGLTFLNFTPFSLCVPVPEVKLLISIISLSALRCNHGLRV